MSSPSSARVNASSSKVRSSKRDVGPSASRSRAFGASSVSNSSRQVAGTGAGAGGRSSARVYLDGVDVTPQSLLVSRIKPSTAHDQRAAATAKAKARGSRAGGGGASVMGASVILSQDHFSTSSIDDQSDSDAGSSNANANAPRASNNQREQGGVAKPAAKAAPLAAASSTTTTTSAAAAPAAVGPEDDDAGAADTDGVDAAPKMLGDLLPALSSLAVTETAVAKPERKIRRPVTIEMVETPTEMLFELRSVCVAQDASHHQAVAARNRQYTEMCAAKKGSDKFVEGRSQTLQLSQKAKEVMTAPPATRDSACMATDWDIFDCARIDDENANDHDDTGAMDAGSHARAKSAGSGDQESGEAQLKQQVNEIVDATMVSPGCVLDVDGDIVEDLKARQHALRHARKHRHGAGNTSSLNNSQKSRAFHHSSANQSSQDVGRSTANVLSGGNSSSSMASPSQSSGNVSFGASQDAVGGGGGGGEDSGNSVQNSQAGIGASQVFSGGNESDDGKQNAYARANTNVDIGLTIAQQRTAKVLTSASLLKTVSVVERAVQQNVYHRQHVLYRNFPTLAPITSPSDPIRKERHVVDHDWRSTIGLTSDAHSSTSNIASSLVPPIGGFSTSGLGGGVGVRGSALGLGGARTGLEKLWAFQCELTEGRTVTCLAWNTVNEDLLAVAYSRAEARPHCPSAAALGASSPSSGANAAAAAANNAAATTVGGAPATAEDDGLVLFWSLKNPEFPERIYNLNIGVTSIDFSTTHPYLLAAGFANGVVAIYDTRKDDAQPPSHDPLKGLSSAPVPGGRPNSAVGDGAASVPHRRVPVAIASSETSSGKHLDAVWQVKWISKGSDRGENVVSISSDGRVTEWSMKKGLSFSDLMTLKRVPNPLLGSDSSADGVISRQASGHCIDFAKHDPSVYYVGTEDGIIHKCSVSYNEQYLQTYYGHTGPVYQIIVSPFSPDLFLSCSADWNVKLWHQGEQNEALNFRSVNLQHAVLGISWCPSDATMFGTVTEDGRIEIWDLQHSSLDPIITHYPKKFVIPPPVISTAPVTGAVAGLGFDPLDDLAGTSAGIESRAQTADTPQAPCEVPLECTKIAFAPSAPVIVVGDSTGDVTVYRVPALADGRGVEHTSVDDQIARLHRAMNPNKQE